MNKKLVEKMEYLDKVIRSGKYPRDISMLGPGSGTFYQAANASRWALMKMKQRNQNNRKQWDLHLQRIDALVTIAREGNN